MTMRGPISDPETTIKEKTMEQNEILICECSSVEHQIVLRYDDEDKDEGLAYAEIHLVKLPFFKRLLRGLKYIFGYKCKYGDFEEIILSPKHARQIYFLYRHLNKPNLDNGQAETQDKDNDSV